MNNIDSASHHQDDLLLSSITSMMMICESQTMKCICMCRWWDLAHLILAQLQVKDSSLRFICS
ncbi:uncharacterized protein ASCRUDRAFT_74956 [Ascoidea rubescens DSM 1968]|uniref:Uncharacterized protein n=1 Tax=Ascoidea rubescens DSM 1968 TaxID=1344418 RepID=A0A1D2VLW9_9ASCO|nr:hypothetical protein ASCRUDRAFT_74956 [Ascoidea rubescens DSM 1968]ODV62608.1 hypothetical protein ASCRUDRAFT_74956 [Ascoidea rubescens DSM 1968]